MKFSKHKNNIINFDYTRYSVSFQKKTLQVVL